MAYSIDIINLAISYYKRGFNLSEISKIINVSLISLKRWNEIYNFSDCCFLKDKIKIIRESKINKYKDLILDVIKKDYKVTLKELKEKINNDASVSTIHRMLKNEKITYKKTNNKLVFKDLESINNDRKEWIKNKNINDFLNGIHVDESSFCIGDIKNYGYSKKGKRIENIKPARSRERYSLLLAISRNKIMNYKIYKNSITSNEYLSFLSELNNEGNINVFQDNARIHHSVKVKNYCKSSNINQIFNPAYTPEFNPIENVFSCIKTAFRKLNHDNIIKDIKESINCITSEILNNCYRNAKKIILSYL